MRLDNDRSKSCAQHPPPHGARGGLKLLLRNELVLPSLLGLLIKPDEQKKDAQPGAFRAIQPHCEVLARIASPRLGTNEPGPWIEPET